MGDPNIRPLAPADLDEALRLSTVAGWNQRLDDWKMLLRLAPAGAFAAVLDARVIGTSIGIDYGGFGWIAMMLVDPVYRGRGIGRRLLEAAIDSVPPALPVRLDATPLGRPLYRRYGFEDEAALSRYVIDAKPKLGATGGPRPSLARPLADEDLDAVIEQDRAVFGGTRAVLVEWAYRAARQYAYVARSADGVSGYCLGREGRLFDQVGPVVAAEDDRAIALVDAALGAAVDRPVAVDAFDARAAFGAALQARGFLVQRPLVRMRRPGRSSARTPDSNRDGAKEFAIFGPEFA